MNNSSSDFDRLHSEFTAAVLACRVDPGKHAVHSLRTGTRKLEALLRKVLEDHPGAGQLHKASRKAQSELKRMRKAAGPVRDLDVHRKVAEELHDQARPSLSPKEAITLTSDYKKLDRSLRRRRKQAAGELGKLLKKREVRLEGALEDSAEAIRSMTGATPPLLETATKWSEKVSLRDLDPGADSFEEQLHGFRKETKAARYIAGLQESSAKARRLAERLKAMQDSIGRWHDLLLLAGEAADVLGKRSALTSFLRAQRDSALDEATQSLHKGRPVPPRP